jgi:pyruvate kinase
VSGRRAKLVCTLGPASAHPKTVRDLVDAGMDVARVNFSHGTDRDHREALRLVREASDEAGRTVAALADLSGPKVRLGDLARGEVFLRTGARFELRPDGEPGDAHGAPTNHPALAEDLEPGDRVLLADGAVELVVTEIRGREVVTEVTKADRGGRVGNRAGVNVPAERLSLPSITDKDRKDLARALDLGFDVVAQSFVRSASDVQALRSMMGHRRVPIVAKMETRPAVEAAVAIAEVADGVMVARGDLGVEIPLEEIPVIQKDLIRTCRRAATPAIVATQMFESMLTSARPTRAEVSDAANAVLDGADAVMLSGETAIGEYPVEAARTARRVIEVAEERGGAWRLPVTDIPIRTAGQAVARAASRVIGGTVDIAAVACFTRSGRTATLIAAERPDVPVFAFASDPTLVRALAAVWGVTPVLTEAPEDIDALIAMMEHRLVDGRLVEPGRTVVMVAATPVGRAPTNLLKVHRLALPDVR